MFQYKCTIFRKNKMPDFDNELLMENCYLYGHSVYSGFLIDTD